MSTLSLELIVLDPSKPEHHQVIEEAGSCTDGSTEGEAARDALRDLQDRCERLAGQYDAELVRALRDPVGAISDRRFV